MATIEEEPTAGACCICLSELDEVTQAKMEFCRHMFHIDCILTWGKRVNLCPLCKTEFRSIIFQGKKIDIERDNPHNRKEIEDDSSSEYDGDGMIFGSDDEEEDNLYCEVCEEECTSDGVPFTFCRGNCGKYVHLSCRGLRSREERWYCIDCQPRRPTTNSRRSSTSWISNPQRSQAVANSLSWAEDSISRQLRLMRHRMERTAQATSVSLPIPTLKTNSNAVSLRSKSQLAHEIESEMKDELQKSSNETSSPSESVVAYKRIRRETTPRNTNYPNTASQNASQQSLTLTSKLAANTQISRRNMESNAVNDLFSRITSPGLAREYSNFTSSSGQTSYMTTTTGTATTSHLQFPSNFHQSYSTVRPADNTFLSVHQPSSSSPSSSSSSSSHITITTQELTEQYISQLQSPLKMKNVEHQKEKIIEMIPKIFSLCTLRNNSDFLVGLLDNGLLSILSLYLSTSASVPDPFNHPISHTSTPSELTSSPQQSERRNQEAKAVLSKPMQEMILRTIHCLPIQSRHLFHIRRKGNQLQHDSGEREIKIGKFISLFAILSKYVVQMTGRGEITGRGSVGTPQRIDDTLSKLGAQILTVWKSILKHYPSAQKKIDSILEGVVESLFK
jgi:hypothetical protein